MVQGQFVLQEMKRKVGGISMAECCVCGIKIGGFLEDKYKINETSMACYKCAPIFRKLENANSSEQIMRAEEELLERMKENNVSKEAERSIRTKIQQIKDRKEGIYLEEKFRKQTEEDINKKKREILVTTGYNFEGYHIKEYLNLIHGEIVIGTGYYSELTASISDIFGLSSNAFKGKLVQAKKAVEDQMITNAVVVGANAIISVDFDILTFSNNMIAVSGNGTAVVVEKEK